MNELYWVNEVTQNYYFKRQQIPHKFEKFLSYVCLAGHRFNAVVLICIKKTGNSKGFVRGDLITA